MRPPAIVCVFVLYTKIFFSDEKCEKTHFDFSWYIEMTDQEETLLEPTEETENSEIVSDNDDQTTVDGDLPVIEDTLELSEDDEDMEMLEDDDEGYMMDMGGLLSSVLATEEGDTVCSALVNISRNLEVQNKILIKMLAQLQKKIT